MKVGSIVIRCYEFDKMLAFWQEALHYVPREPAKDGWVVLRDPKGRGPNVSLDQVPNKRSGKRNRLHLDLYTSDRESADVPDGGSTVSLLGFALLGLAAFRRKVELLRAVS